jgi:diguanylate cyclase (GGDEF)-like protein
VWRATASIGNVVLLVVIAATVKAIAHAIRLKQREAYSLLIAWSPLMAMLVVRIGAMQDWWPMFEWLEFGFPAAVCVAGLGLIFGMTHKLRQLWSDHETARHRARHDGLTGVLTRAALEEALADVAQRARSSGDPLSVVFLDIDHFKQINDEHGHAMGDEVLRIVAARTRNRLRPFDLFGRYGGDEMLIGLIGAPLDQALALAEHVRKGVSDGPVVIEGRRLTVGLSLGVAQFRDGETLDALLRRADAALYASKAGGRGRVTVDGLSPGPNSL